jgi:hypothetical protein
MMGVMLDGMPQYSQFILLCYELLNNLPVNCSYLIGLNGLFIETQDYCGSCIFPAIEIILYYSDREWFQLMFHMRCLC